MKEYPIRIETRDLSAGYEGKQVLEQMDIKVRAGEILVLLGPNGSGKSTLLRSMAGQLRPLAGTVYLNGEDLAHRKGEQSAKMLSFLSTSRMSAELMTCRDVVCAGRYPYTGRMGILSKADLEIVRRSMERMGASALADLPFERISDGQKQRILLAQALCQEPQVLLLDEPASYLDIRYQLELVRTIRQLAREDQLAIILSLHDIDLARRCATRVLCLKDGRTERIGSAREILTNAYMEELFDLAEGSLGQQEMGDEKPSAPDRFACYTRSGTKMLRCGYTTGTCAALASAASASALLGGIWPSRVSLRTPKGPRVEVSPEQEEMGDGFARCGVRKDAGDDIDCTDGILICSQVRFRKEPGICIRGGEGVGIVTKPGLDQPVNEAAINAVPRQMIIDAVRDVCLDADYTDGLEITISVPGGEELAKKTFNPKLGITGGISILGTSGIVEPMSQQAFMDSIALELRQHYAQGSRRVILTPGNYGMDFLHRQGLDNIGVPMVKCSNYIGETLDEASVLGFAEVLLAGHIGKLVKLAGGIMNTHSRQADCRCELFCAHAALCGAPQDLLRNLMNCISTDACIGLLTQAGLLDGVMKSLLDAIGRHVENRLGQIPFGVILFSNVCGYLGETTGTREMIDAWKLQERGNGWK